MQKSDPNMWFCKACHTYHVSEKNIKINCLAEFSLATFVKYFEFYYYDQLFIINPCGSHFWRGIKIGGILGNI